MGTDPVPQAAVPAVEPARPIAEHQIPTPQRPSPVTRAGRRDRIAEYPAPRACHAGGPRGEWSGSHRDDAGRAPERISRVRCNFPRRSSRWGPGCSSWPTSTPARKRPMPGRQDGSARAVRESRFVEHRQYGHGPESARTQPTMRLAGSGGFAARSSAAAGLVAAAPVVIEQVMAHAPRRLGDGQPLPEPYRLRSIPQRQELALNLAAAPRRPRPSKRHWPGWPHSRNRMDAGMPDDGAAGIEHKVAGHDREGAARRPTPGSPVWRCWHFWPTARPIWKASIARTCSAVWNFCCAARASDGNLAGSARLYARMYCHGMASLALSEALAHDRRRADSTLCRTGRGVHR